MEMFAKCPPKQTINKILVFKKKTKNNTLMHPASKHDSFITSYLVNKLGIHPRAYKSNHVQQVAARTTSFTPKHQGKDKEGVF